jgi:eukaryotic-like serine/threonine-protein kinase
MNSIYRENHASDERIGEAIVALLNSLEAGQKPDLHQLQTQYPDLDTELHDFLADWEQLEELAAPLREVAHASSSGTADPDAPLPDLSGPKCTLASHSFGDYEVLEEIGRGGMGVVYEAEQISLGRRVALKVLPFAATMDPRHLQRFQNEARAAASLEHPNIVPVYGVGCERGVHFYAMKFIDGQTMAALIAGQRQTSEPRPSGSDCAPSLPNGRGSDTTSPQAAFSTQHAPRDTAAFRQIAEWGIQAAEALEHAHSFGIVHRDIKPANLMIDGQGKLWVTDFGLARTGTDGGLTLTGDVLGTLRYMSPEQAQASHGFMDHRTDVYSLGVTLYELLTGRPAVDGKDREQILNAITLDEPRLPRSLDPAIPTELETIVLKAMEKEPADRYSTARELADDLRRYVEDKPIKARRATLLQKLRKWCHRHQPVVTTAIVSAVALLALSVALLWEGNRRIRHERDQKDEALADAEENFRMARQAVDSFFTRVSQSKLLDVPGLQPLRMELLEAAVQYYRALTDKRSADPSVQADLAVAHFRLFEVYYEVGHHNDAVRELDAGLALVEHLLRDHRGDSDLIRQLPGFWKGTRRMWNETPPPDDRAAAERSLNKFIQIWEKLAAQNPGQPAFQSDLATMYDRLGQLLGWESEEAVASCAKAAALWEGLARAYPNEPEYLAALGQEYDEMSAQVGFAGKPGDQVKLLDKALAIREKLVASYPNVPQYRVDLAESITGKAIQLFREGKTKEAETIGRRALESWEKLAGDYPYAHPYTKRYGAQWVRALTVMSGHFEASGRPQEAEAAYRQLIVLYDNLLAEYPKNFQFRAAIATSQLKLGSVLAKAGLLHEAEKARSRALTARAILEKLAEEVPAKQRNSYAWGLVSDPDPEVREFLAVVAVKLAKKAVELAPRDGNIWNTLGVARYREGDWWPAIEALQKSMEMRQGGDSFDWFFLAMAHYRLGHEMEGRHWYDQAVQWMDKNKPNHKELRRFRTEAAAMLKLEDKNNHHKDTKDTDKKLR